LLPYNISWREWHINQVRARAVEDATLFDDVKEEFAKADKE
jgi:hypothetical protein